MKSFQCEGCGGINYIFKKEGLNYVRKCTSCGRTHTDANDNNKLHANGICHLELGNYAEAAKIFKDLIVSVPDDYRPYLGSYLSEYCMGRPNARYKDNAIKLVPEEKRELLGNLEIRDLEQEQKDIARLEYLNRTSSLEHLKTQYEREYVDLIDQQKNHENVMLTKIKEEKEELHKFKRKSRFHELKGLIINFFLGILSGLKRGLIFGAITIIPYIVIFFIATGNSGVSEYWNEYYWLDPFFIACLIVFGLSGMVTFIKEQYRINSEIKAKIRTQEAKIDDSYRALNRIKTLLPQKIDELNSKYERLKPVYEQNRVNNQPEIRLLERRIALSQSLNNVEYYYPLLSVTEES